MVEVALVAGTIMLATALSVPTVGRNIEQFRLDSAAYSVAGDLQMARIQALKYNSSRTMNILVANCSWNINGSSPRYLSYAVSFGSNTPAAVAFDYRGRSTSAGPLTITLNGLRSATRTITVHTSGRITVN